DGLHEQLKKPSELDSAIEDVNNVHKNQQESEVKAPPLVDILKVINNNPKEAREALANKFNEVRLSDWIQDLTQDYRFEAKKQELEEIRQNTKDLDFRQRIGEITKAIKTILKEEYPSSLRFVDINGIELFDPNFVLVGVKSSNTDAFMRTPPRGADYYDPRITENSIASMKTIEVLDYLNDRYYRLDRDISLVMMTMDGVTIPNQVLLADWLEAHGYSIHDDIVVMPVSLNSNDKELFTQA
ncbi:unnamed protein product, partial [marine sediment metagenome]